MSTTIKQDRREYQRIVTASGAGKELKVLFEDGSRVVVDVERLLPPDTRMVRGGTITFNPHEVILPTSNGPLEVPWSAIRVLTDGEYAAYLAVAAEEEARQVGVRLKELRTSRGLTSKELAGRAGITPQSLSRIEHGRHDVVLITLQRIVAAIGCTLKDLVTDGVAPANGIASDPEFQTTQHSI